jgi:hypothetical protein
MNGATLGNEKRAGTIARPVDYNIELHPRKK